MQKRLILFVLMALPFVQTWAQKRIVVIGSSTAAGTGASTYDSAWVGRLQGYFRKNTSPSDPDTIINNLAIGGTTTYDGMPTGFVPPNGRPGPNTSANVTAALNLNPDVVIINYPTNDAVNFFSKKETMDNLRTMRQYLLNAGKRVFITTTQPRNVSADLRDTLITTRDSININFGPFAVDFWTDIANPDGTIKTIVNADGTHVNNLGHYYLFLQALSEELFPLAGPLPLKLTSFELSPNTSGAILKWSTVEEEPNTVFKIERSANAKDFATIGEINGKGSSTNNYEWTDKNAAKGKWFYRLQWIEAGRSSLSRVLSLNVSGNPFAIQSIVFTSSGLNLSVQSANAEKAEVSLYSISGVLVTRSTQQLQASMQTINIPLTSLAPGKYIVQVRTASGISETATTVKLK